MTFHLLIDEDHASDEELRWMEQNQGCFYAMRRAGWNDNVDGDRHAILTRFFPPTNQIIRVTVPVELLNQLPSQQAYAVYWESCCNNHPELQLASKVKRIQALAAEGNRRAEKARDNVSGATLSGECNGSHQQGKRAGIGARFDSGD